MGQEKATSGALIAAYGHTEKKVKAEEMLIGAMLREPHNMHRYIDKVNEVALANASNGLNKAFAEILEQFKTRGTYSLSSIIHATGMEHLTSFASKDVDLDLDWALIHWSDQYSVWAETEALTASAAAEHIEQGAMAMRAAAEAVRQKLGANHVQSTSDGRAEFEAWIKDRVDGKVETYKCNPPLFELRKIVNGWRPGEMIIVAGRPGMGKTQFALNIFSELDRQGARGLFFSLEMVTSMLMQRLMGIRSGINPRGDLRGVEALYEAGKDVLRIKSSIIDDVFSIDGIENRAMYEYYQGNLDFIIVDYLQLITYSSPKNMMREQVVSHISGALTRLSKRLRIPVIVLSQLSRAVETRGGAKRPMLSDLRESGSLEQDASVVIFPYRPEYYDIIEDEAGNSLRGIGELIVAKQRNGPTDTAVVGYDPIRGYKDKESTQFPLPSPTPEPDLSAHRPGADQDIPF